MIYADNAATTKLDMDAFEAMKPYLLNEYANASQPYSFARGVKKALKQARVDIATCINASPDEIYFTSGGTESDNWAIKGVALYENDHRRMITSAIEHHAVLRSCEAIERLGYPAQYIKPDRYGVICPEKLENAITADTKLVSIMYANNEIGTIEPIKELCEIAHQHGALFHTDAVQAVGHVPIDVQKLGVDMLSASAHKFNGPKGIGFLYIRKGTKIVPYASGGGQEFGLRAGTENVALIVGMACALKKCCARINESIEHLISVENAFLQALDEQKIDYVRNGSSPKIAGNVSVSIANANGEMLLHRLDLMGICVSTGSACNSQVNELSHVVDAIGVPERYAHGTIRVSFGVDNTVEDAVKVARAVGKIVANRKA